MGHHRNRGLVDRAFSAPGAIATACVLIVLSLLSGEVPVQLLGLVLLFTTIGYLTSEITVRRQVAESDLEEPPSPDNPEAKRSHISPAERLLPLHFAATTTIVIAALTLKAWQDGLLR